MATQEQFSILDQVEVTRDRAIQVRFAIVTLEDGMEPPEGTQYCRGVMAPGDNPDEFLARYIKGLTDVLGWPRLDQRPAEMVLQPVTAAVHTDDVKSQWDTRRQRLAKDGPNTRDVPIREQLRLGGGRQRLAAPDANGYQHDSVIHQVWITRARTIMIDFGLVSIKGEQEMFRRLNRAVVKPTMALAETLAIMRKGLRDKNDPVLTTGAETYVTAIETAVHTQDRAQRYAQLRDAQLLEILRKHQESGRSGEPRVPPEISKEAALRVALEG